MAKKDLTNPLTGKGPNEFTQVTNRQLDTPMNVRQFGMVEPERKRMRAEHREATAPVTGTAQAQIGYQKPEGMNQQAFTWLMGGHHMFPNAAAEAGTPAINEPHAAEPGVTVQRRAEDLSGPEVEKGKAALVQYGHNPRNPIQSLQDTQAIALNRVMAEHAQAGVEESASQHFYGGTGTNTQLPTREQNLQHQAGIRAANERFSQSAQNLAQHPDFVGRTPNMSPHERFKGAKNIMAQATADTSPNAKWRMGEKWPNIEQAEESVASHMEGREPRFITGRIQNVYKAGARADEMLNSGQFDPSEYGSQRTAPKTIAFRGALVNQNSPDAYKVSDVHEGSVMAPGLPTKKGLAWAQHNEEGERTGPKMYQYPDSSARDFRTLTPVYDPAKPGKQEVGNSRVENMLAVGPQVHALNDYASRKALAEAGLSRGINYADNIHAMQGATWGSQQVRRPDVMVSHADQYPVVRDWAAEGHAALNDMGEKMFGGRTRGMGPQFVSNPNTVQINKKGDQSHNPTVSKPYPITG